MSDTPARRVAIVADGRRYVGPEMARMLARRDHDLVLGDPEPELVSELESLGVRVESVEKALSDSIAEYGPATRVGVIPKGPYVLPYVGKA